MGICGLWAVDVLWCVCMRELSQSVCDTGLCVFAVDQDFVSFFHVETLVPGNSDTKDTLVTHIHTRSSVTNK